MADNDRGHDKLNSIDVYLNTIAKHIRVYQEIKKEFPHLSVGADDLIRTLKQLEKDFTLMNTHDGLEPSAMMEKNKGGNATVEKT